MCTSLFTWSGTCPAWLSAPGGYECFQASLDWGWNRFHSLLSPGVLSTSHCCTSTHTQNSRKSSQTSSFLLLPSSFFPYGIDKLPYWTTPLAHLFDMEEVFSLKGDGHAWHRDIIVVTRAVADICADGKCNWFGLAEVTKEGKKRKCQISQAIICFQTGGNQAQILTRVGRQLLKVFILIFFEHYCQAVILVFVWGVKITPGERYQQPLTHPDFV